MDPLFGSGTRARVLEQLATTPRPQSAYRIARAIGAEPIQVLRILRGLSEFTQRTSTGWLLTNDLLRDFLRDRARRDEKQTRREKVELLLELGLRASSGDEPD